MNIIASIEARMTSSRLPGKVMMKVLDKPILEYMIERVQKSKYIKNIIVATTKNQEDDPIVSLCQKLTIPYYRGSEEDVLKRVVEAHKTMNTDIIVELTGDCPLIDFEIIDKVIEAYKHNNVDYVSNILKRTYPIGMDAQVFKFNLLEEIDRITDNPLDREHVSIHIYQHPEKYSLLNVEAEETLNWADLRLTLDYQQDYQLIKSIIEKLYPENKFFILNDILSLLRKQPELIVNHDCSHTKIDYKKES